MHFLYMYAAHTYQKHGSDIDNHFRSNNEWFYLKGF